MLSSAQQSALREIAAAAVAAERETGCPAELSAAQCILESGWLARLTGEFNCFGIKALPGEPCKNCQTHEFIGGRRTPVSQAFRSFASLAECFAHHGRLLQRGPYAAAWARYQQNNSLDGLIADVAPVYATDPEYAGQVSRLARQPSVFAAIVAARTATL